ncbi:hypothetical protein MCOR27_006844 [Pyricularia oryzae]|uniref:Uncharacterized protein n=3 Tax=Pyricularia oryzae TaxID=318829 RepID=A0A4P7NV89_PYROR|nr:hypothetical protein OOU_Y34scaffold00969g33 [Pyricularia oryzae Y34]KAH8837982.1 hypothetical protein MCOR01_009427 [Pyricularia oryzae]KAI6261206.1 hypothetical protein MCOR19_002504 [Pyricularia oryzae]KAI6275721.1 hypothetical protein MCOR27_006844 [Pyricularia oryzae]KAI6327125.1 hypothetical protein MCOR34_000554 [Pyricularia oryzae]
MPTPSSPSKSAPIVPSPSRPQRGETQDRIPASVGAESGPGPAPAKIEIPRARATLLPSAHATSEPSHVSTASGNVSVAIPNRGRSEGSGDGAQTGPTGYVYFPTFATSYDFWASRYIERV